MSPAIWVPLLVVGNLTLVGTILFVVFSLVARATRQRRAQLETEGVELDSGAVTIKTHMRDFRAPGVAASAMVGIKRGYVVLTARRFIVLQVPLRYGDFERSVLGAFQVVAEAGKIHIRSTEPPGATGTVEWTFAVADPDRWVSTLTAAGMRRAG